MTPPGTRLRNFRCPDELWEAAKLKARAEGRDLSDVLRTFLTEYVETPASLPAPGA